ncbi:MAG: CDP-alcohol phosphatidyltransferase family protein [Spirochaetota bacterium]|nr:CDP-alcohol phosphatidyltransferase family protein [Spirochaetota bacterium]
MTNNLYTKDDVKSKLMRPYSWWAYICILPFVRPLSLVIANKTNFTPNQITFFSFFLSIISFVLFIYGDAVYLIIGGFFFELSYIFDCVDGTIARLKNNGTYFGELWDHLLDRVKDNGLFFAIAYGQYNISGDISWFYYSFFIIIVFSIYNTRVQVLEIIELKHSMKLKEKMEDIGKKKRNNLMNDVSIITLVKRWIRFSFNHDLNPNPGAPETEALIFFIAPILSLFFGVFVIKICIFLGGLSLILFSTLRTILTIKVSRKII